MDLQQLCNCSSVEGMRLVVRNNELKAVKKEEITWTECARAKLGLGGAASMKKVAAYVMEHNQEVFKSDNGEAMMKFFKKFEAGCEKYNASRWLPFNKVDSR
ncbi:MAG: hypothetical protein KDK65_03760, partial [Chlamydiia bacterium]|nr:hypothetical protein [Chlamydiia bacterium]